MTALAELGALLGDADGVAVLLAVAPAPSRPGGADGTRTPEAVAGATGLSRPSVAEALSRLDDRSLVVPAGDGYRVTPTGALLACRVERVLTSMTGTDDSISVQSGGSSR